MASETSYLRIDRDRLAKKLAKSPPDNTDRVGGYALVYVAGRRSFLRERIPGSTNVAGTDIAPYLRRFDRRKEIVVYGPSGRSDTSEVARRLAAAGFERILEYENGLREWRDSGQPLAGTAHPANGSLAAWDDSTL
jgi:rhodanese-related sulfurtransferase